MDLKFKHQAITSWAKYFLSVPMPYAAFYCDDLYDAEYVKKPAENSKGFTCIFTQMAKLRKGISLAFDADNIGCYGAIKNLYGRTYNEEVTVKLLVEIERFKQDREQVVNWYSNQAKAKPLGKYFIIKSFNKLEKDDKPSIYFCFVKPDIIAALHTLACFDDSRIDAVIAPFGAGCEQMFLYAFDEASKNNPRCILCGLDTSMRTCLKSDLLGFSIPAKKFEIMVANMDDSFLNTHTWEALKRRIE